MYFIMYNKQDIGKKYNGVSRFANYFNRKINQVCECHMTTNENQKHLHSEMIIPSFGIS